MTFYFDYSRHGETCKKTVQKWDGEYASESIQDYASVDS
jgi:hypothetical protein